MADGAAACSSGGVRFIDVVGEIPKGDNDVLLVVMVGCAIAHWVATNKTLKPQIKIFELFRVFTIFFA
jgi:hypothetical protein